MIMRYDDMLPNIGGKKNSYRPAHGYQAKRVDENQPSIVKTFRKAGCMVQHLHTVGDGCFDLIISVDFLNIFVEVKNYKKVPSARALTDPQKRWNFAWTGLRAVVTTDYEAMTLVADARKLVEIFRQAAIDAKQPLQVRGCTESMYRPQLF